MSKRDLEELLRRLAYAAYKVARDYGCRNDLRFRMSDYRTSIAHAKSMRREERWSAEVERRIAAIGGACVERRASLSPVPSLKRDGAP